MRSAKTLLLCAAAALTLSSCGPPSYPEDQVAERLVGVCNAEYHMRIKAQVADTTLGAVVEIPGLIDELRKQAQNPKRASSAAMETPPVVVEGKYARKAFDFRLFTRGGFTRVEEDKTGAADEDTSKEPSKPLRKLRQVSTALMRACLSTDRKLEFYKLIARDPGPDHYDVVFAGHILDTKMVQMYMISFSELQGRNEVSLRHQPEEIARSTVENFILDLRKRPLPQLLSRYTAPSKRFGELLPMVLNFAMVLKGEEGKLDPQDWAIRQTAPDEALVFISLKPLGQPDAFLFTVQLGDEAGTLLSIEELDRSVLPKRYRPLGSPEHWSDFFYLEPLSLPVFLTQQIAKRVMSQFKPIHPAGKQSEKGSAEEPATTQDVMKALMGDAAYVTKNYDFKDFSEVSAVDAVNGTRWVVPASHLPLYRRKDSPEIKSIP